MNKRDRLRAEELKGLIEICRTRGINSNTLRPYILHLFTDHICPPKGDNQKINWWDEYKERQTEGANRLSDAGLTAQLCHLRTVWGSKRLMAKLMETGGVLDAIVMCSSSTDGEIESDIGSDNVDENGDVW